MRPGAADRLDRSAIGRVSELLETVGIIELCLRVSGSPLAGSAAVRLSPAAATRTGLTLKPEGSPIPGGGASVTEVPERLRGEKTY